MARAWRDRPYSQPRPTLERSPGGAPQRQLSGLGPFMCLPGKRPADAKSVRRRFRQEVDHRHAGDNQRNADYCWRIQALIEEAPADERDENDPDAGPHRVRNSNWNAVER